MIRVLWHDDPALNSKINKWASILTIISIIGAGVVWASPWADKLHATEPEAEEIVEEAMSEHNAYIDQQPYAMKNDVNHVLNVIVDGDVAYVKEKIKKLEDKEDTEGLSALEARQLQRAREGLDAHEKRYVPEPGSLPHNHDGN